MMCKFEWACARELAMMCMTRVCGDMDGCARVRACVRALARACAVPRGAGTLRGTLPPRQGARRHPRRMAQETCLRGRLQASVGRVELLQKLDDSRVGAPRLVGWGVIVPTQR